MKNKHILLQLLLLSFLIPLHSQDDVKLFDFWKYYTDAEHVMYLNSCELAFKQLQERELHMAQLHTSADYLARQEEVKDKLLQLIGPFPEKTPLNPRITGVIRKQDFRVEKLMFESIPGYYVTAALFIPEKLQGKAPAIIYACGHTANGFRSDTYQHIIINLVKKGFVVLAFDPVGQGERLQYYDEKTGKSPFGPTKEHSYPGAQCYISGHSPTRYFIWDGIRCVDYLLTRKEVDPERIGMTGRSGGGTQTAYTAAVDERILAAAPECFITSMEYILKSIGPQDAEQNLVHMISEGLDHADLLEVRAPRPGMMITTTRDFFSIQGARETFSEVKQFYEALGAGEHIHMVEDDDAHSSTRKNREAMYAFFQKYLENPGSPADLDVEVFEERELWVTESGQLATSVESETLYSLNQKVARNQLAELKQLRRSEDFHEYATKATKEAKRLSGFQDPEEYGQAVFSGRFVHKGYKLETYLVPGSGDYMLPAALFTPLEKQNKEVILFLHDQGMEYATHEDSLMIHALLQQGYAVLLFDVPGIGSLGPGYLKGDAYIDNTSFNQWFAGILTNKSIVGMRAEDILRITHFADRDPGAFASITALASGAVGSEILHAAVFLEGIQNVVLIEPFLSFADIALTREYAPEFIPSTVAGAIDAYDLPDLLGALCPRKVMIINPLSANGDPADDKEKSCHLSYPRIVFTQQGLKDHFTHIVVDEGKAFPDHIISWLNR
jgi:cephalosporin-C deacetylase-like acetyl esterase